MPNYVTNVIRMRDITNLPLFTIEQGKRCFDFNKLIPMPGELNVVSGSMTEENIIYYLTERCTIPVQCLSDDVKEMVKRLVSNILYDSEYGWAEEVFRRVSIKAYNSSPHKRVTMYEAGKNYVSNYQKYGAVTWDEWCNTHWNTKWNASCTEIIDKDTIRFVTACDCPIPVISKLAERYPNTKIECWCKEERHQSSGYFYFENGVLTGGDEEKKFTE